MYDADCPWCARVVGWCGDALARRGFAVAALQEPRARARLGLPAEELMAEMKLLRADGAVFGGAEALLELARHFAVLAPLRWAARWPSVRRGLGQAYAWVARHRPCAKGGCRMRRPGRKIVFLELP